LVPPTLRRGAAGGKRTQRVPERRRKLKVGLEARREQRTKCGDVTGERSGGAVWRSGLVGRGGQKGSPRAEAHLSCAAKGERPGFAGQAKSPRRPSESW
jgi:hypothetical protein